MQPCPNEHSSLQIALLDSLAAFVDKLEQSGKLYPSSYCA